MCRTESGNTYRIERSTSQAGMLRIHNEREAGEWQYAVPTPGKSTVFEVGQQMHYAVLNDPGDRSKGAKGWQTSTVTGIEVWRNHAKAQEEIEQQMRSKLPQGGGLGNIIAATVKNTVRQTVHHRDYKKK